MGLLVPFAPFFLVVFNYLTRLRLRPIKLFKKKLYADLFQIVSMARQKTNFDILNFNLKQ